MHSVSELLHMVRTFSARISQVDVNNHVLRTMNRVGYIVSIPEVPQASTAVMCRGRELHGSHVTATTNSTNVGTETSDQHPSKKRKLNLAVVPYTPAASPALKCGPADNVYSAASSENDEPQSASNCYPK